MTDPVARLAAALADRYRIEPERLRAAPADRYLLEREGLVASNSPIMHLAH